MRICRALLIQVAVTYLSLTIKDGNPTTLRCATLTKVLINLKTDCSTTFLWGNLIKKDLNLYKAQLPTDAIAQSYLLATLSDELIRRDTLGY